MTKLVYAAVAATLLAPLPALAGDLGPGDSMELVRTKTTRTMLRSSERRLWSKGLSSFTRGSWWNGPW